MTSGSTRPNFYSKASADTSMKRFGSKVNNFWEPGYEPESDKTAFKPKDVDKECFIFLSGQK